MEGKEKSYNIVPEYLFLMGTRKFPNYSFLTEK
jgi:hypothetical protein